MRVWFFLPVFLSLSLIVSGAMPARAADEAAPAATGVDTTQNLPAKPPTASERSALRRAQNELRLRAMMSDFGIEAAAPQDALIGYLAEDEAGKSALRGAARRLMMAVRTGTTPERMRDLIAVYKAAIDADKERRRAAQTTLDAKIGFSLDPRLEATLWLLGVLGEGQSNLSLGALTARAPKNAPGEGGRDALREIGARRGNAVGGSAVGGVVTRKAGGWIEVRADNGTTDRYTPFWTEEERTAPAAGAPPEKPDTSRATLETLTRVQIGQRVRLEWAWSARKRVLSLDILPPEPAPLPATGQAPNLTDPPPPAPAYPAP